MAPRAKHVIVKQITKGRAKGQFTYQLIGANGEPMDGQSEPYANRGNARRAARRLFPDVELRNVG